MKLSQIDLNLLVALDALLAERNVSRAGDRIGLSQPVMSRALGRLRRIFDDPLLLRVGAEYHRTPLAEELMVPLREILRRIEETVERRLTFDPATDTHVFRIAASEYCSYLILRPLAALWSVEAPFVSMQVRSITGRRTVEQIELGEVDLGLWSDRVRPPHLERQLIISDRLVLAYWPASAAGRSPESLYSMPQIVNYRDPQTMLGIVDPAVPSVPYAETAPVWLESPFQRLQFLEGTSNITIALEKFAREFARFHPIKIEPMPFETRPQAEAMYWHSPMTLDPAHAWLRGQVLAICHTIGVDMQESHSTHAELA